MTDQLAQIHLNKISIPFRRFAAAEGNGTEKFVRGLASSCQSCLQPAQGRWWAKQTESFVRLATVLASSRAARGPSLSDQ